MIERIFDARDFFTARSIENCRSRLTNEGSGYKLISLGERGLNFEIVKTETLLGRKMGYEIDETKLSENERRLLGKDDLKKLTLIDLDGVLMPSPTNVIVEMLSEGIKNNISRITQHGLFGSVKQAGRIDFSTLRFFKEVAKASEKVVIWTHRQNSFVDSIENLPMSDRLTDMFRDTIDYFPFFSETSVANLKKLVGESATFVFGKSGNCADRLHNIVQEVGEGLNPDLIYSFQSNARERFAAGQFVNKFQGYREKLVVLDSGHLIV